MSARGTFASPANGANGLTLTKMKSFPHRSGSATWNARSPHCSVNCETGSLAIRRVPCLWLLTNAEISLSLFAGAFQYGKRSKRSYYSNRD